MNDVEWMNFLLAKYQAHHCDDETCHLINTALEAAEEFSNMQFNKMEED